MTSGHVHRQTETNYVPAPVGVGSGRCGGVSVGEGVETGDREEM